MIFLCYSKCSTCQKAKKWLDEKGINYEFRDIKEKNPNYEEIKKWYIKSGLDIKKFFNTSGILYKEMNLKEKLVDLSEEEKLKLLASNGMLIKRPMLILDEFVLVGFKELLWSEKLNLI